MLQLCKQAKPAGCGNCTPTKSDISCIFHVTFLVVFWFCVVTVFSWSVPSHCAHCVHVRGHLVVNGALRADGDLSVTGQRVP